MTYNEWLLSIKPAPAELRYGQHLFNSLYAIRPELADRVRGTNNDPFHNDSRLQLFFAFVRENW